MPQYFEDPDYQKAEFETNQPEIARINKSKKQFRLSAPSERIQDLIYFSTILLISVGIIANIDSDEIENNIHQSPDNQYFGLPHSKKEAVEIAGNDKNSRQFVSTNSEAEKIVCAESFTRKGDIEYAKNVLPVVRTVVDFPKDRVLFAKESVFSSTSFDTLVTCSYPESDPNEIIHIPIRRAGD